MRLQDACSNFFVNAANKSGRVRFDRYSLGVGARRALKDALIVTKLVRRLDAKEEHRQTACRTSSLTNRRLAQVHAVRLWHDAEPLKPLPYGIELIGHFASV